MDTDITQIIIDHITTQLTKHNAQHIITQPVLVAQPATIHHTAHRIQFTIKDITYRILLGLDNNQIPTILILGQPPNDHHPNGRHYNNGHPLATIQLDHPNSLQALNQTIHRLTQGEHHRILNPTTTTQTTPLTWNQTSTKQSYKPSKNTSKTAAEKPD